MNNRLLTLADGEVVELPDARGTTLRLARGSLWITQAGDRRDIVLSAGEAWTVERHGLTLAEARGDTAVLVAGGAANDPRFRRRSTREGLDAWFRRHAERFMNRAWVPHV
jgi:hypothetical protein